MKFLADENVPQTIVKDLKQGGHNVLDVKKSPLQHANDRSLIKVARREKRVILTYDKDFLKTKSPVAKIVIRIPYANLNLVRRRLEHALENYPVKKSVITIFPDRDEVRTF